MGPVLAAVADAVETNKTPRMRSTAPATTYPTFTWASPCWDGIRMRILESAGGKPLLPASAGPLQVAYK